MSHLGSYEAKFQLPVEQVRDARFDIVDSVTADLKKQVAEKCPPPPAGFKWHYETTSVDGPEVTTIKVVTTLRPIEPVAPED